MEPASKRIKVENIAQPNVRNAGTSMVESLGPIVKPVVSEREKIEQEFVREVGCAFDFGSIVSEEEGALRCLEEMVFGTSKERPHRSAGRMDKLVESFKNRTFEQALRY